MSMTGFNLRRRKALLKKQEPVISKPVVEEKVEVKTEPKPSTTKVVHKKTTTTKK